MKWLSNRGTACALQKIDFAALFSSETILGTGHRDALDGAKLQAEHYGGRICFSSKTVTQFLHMHD